MRIRGQPAARSKFVPEIFQFFHRKPRKSYLEQTFANEKPGVFVAASDYMKALPDGIAAWLPGKLISLGTDGFGRSESRAALRDFFEVDDRFVTLAALSALAQTGQLEPDNVAEALSDLDINPEKINPMHA